MKRISFIVPAFNEERLLGDSLGAIHAAAAVFDERGWTHELIVCDNNSTDRTAEIARGAGAKVVFEPVNQIGRARNAGAASAKGEWLCFVDADSRPDKALMEEVAEHIASGRVLGGGVTIRMDNGKWPARFVTSLWNTVSRTFTLVAGSFIFVEAAAFREIGGFSNEWFAGEELELCRRLKKRASETGQRVIILHRHPLHTSGRKIDLYTPWETLWMLGRALFTGGKSLRRRETTHLWYDGRR